MGVRLWRKVNREPRAWPYCGGANSTHRDNHQTSPHGAACGASARDSHALPMALYASLSIAYRMFSCTTMLNDR